MSTELVSHLQREAGRKLLDMAYNLKIEDPGNHLAEVQAFLQERNGSLILYGNHIAYDDPLLAGLLYLKYFNIKNDRHLVVPASHWHMNPEHNKLFSQGGKMVEKIFEAEMFQLIQSYMVENEEYPGYTQEMAEANRRAFFGRLKELKEQGVPTDVLIYPEGHRSKDGVLQDVGKGFILAGSILKPTVFLPIGESYENDDYARSKPNTRLSFKKPILRIGQPTFMTDAKERPDAGSLMQNLAGSLPSWMQGQYRVQPR